MNRKINKALCATIEAEEAKRASLKARGYAPATVRLGMNISPAVAIAIDDLAVKLNTTKTAALSAALLFINDEMS